MSNFNKWFTWCRSNCLAVFERDVFKIFPKSTVNLWTVNLCLSLLLIKFHVLRWWSFLINFPEFLRTPLFYTTTGWLTASEHNLLSMFGNCFKGFLGLKFFNYQSRSSRCEVSCKKRCSEKFHKINKKTSALEPLLVVLKA